MEIIDKVRGRSDIVGIAQQWTKLKKKDGEKYVGLCPLHIEKTPSFTVDGEKQLFHCFGCGRGGDVFTLVMEKKDFSFPETLKYLAKKYHIIIPPESEWAIGTKKEPAEISKIEMALSITDELRKLLFQAWSSVISTPEKEILCRTAYELTKLAGILEDLTASKSDGEEIAF